MGQENSNSGEQERQPELPCIAMVVSHGDSTYMGRLKVELLRNAGNDNDKSPGQIIEVDYMTPFYGTTNINYVDPDPDDYDNTQKSFGMWMIPPTPGSYVMVIFHNGKIERGYWIGCLPGLDAGSNFSVPGIAATKYNLDDQSKRIPVAEYNKIAQGTQKEETKTDKPRHLFADILDTQGLLEDDIRGITTSSARRETPSMVFGISTPGPVDKNGKQGEIGEAPKKIPNARVSFLGGTTFVMDDGDDKYLRKTAATDGPPEYAADEQGEDGGDNTILHNELVRIRTRTGHQILLHNSEDLIYIGNARGTSWIELSSDGKIDIYAEDSISVHTAQDLNFYADRDINMEAGRNINLKATDAASLGDTTAAGRIQIEAVGDFIRIVNGNVFTQTDGTRDDTITGAVTQSFEATWDVTTGDAVNITTGADLNLNVSGASVVSSSGDFTISAANTAIDGGNINFNSGIAGDAGTATAATAPEPLSTFENPDEADGTLPESIMLRIPTHEPWPHHENLDPLNFKPEMTDREAGSAIATPDAWKVYSTVTDTFEQIQPPEPEPEEDQ